MKFLFLFFASLFLSISTYAQNLKPIPPYAGDIPFSRTIMLDEFAALKPNIKSDADRAKLEDAKQRFKNALYNYDMFQANTKKNNATQASVVSLYEKIFDRLWEIYLENTTKGKKIYDKEFVELLDKALRQNHKYFSDVYKEQGSEIFLKKVEDVNSLRSLLQTEEYIVNHL